GEAEVMRGADDHVGRRGSGHVLRDRARPLAPLARVVDRGDPNSKGGIEHRRRPGQPPRIEPEGARQEATEKPLGNQSQDASEDLLHRTACHAASLRMGVIWKDLRVLPETALASAALLDAAGRAETAP